MFSTNSRSLCRVRSRSVTSSTITIAVSDVPGDTFDQKKWWLVSTSVPPAGGSNPNRLAAMSRSENSGQGSGGGTPGDATPSSRFAAGFA